MESRMRSRILVVDDEPQLCKVLARMLGREFDVTTFVSGGDALAHVEAGHRFDAVLLDVHLAEMDASAFLERVSGVAADLTTRCILMTGDGEAPPGCEHLRLVPKPWDCSELMDTIAAVCRAVRT
jgi:DNA-binding NtrC family response regulator